MSWWRKLNPVYRAFRKALTVEDIVQIVRELPTLDDKLKVKMFIDTEIQRLLRAPERPADGGFLQAARDVTPAHGPEEDGA